MKITIQQLMTQSGVIFGTSGARGLATAMTDSVCYACARGFLQHLQSTRDLPSHAGRIALAGDLRPSTDRIIEAVSRAAEDMGLTPVHCGKIPSPALALFGLEQKIPSIMVTGSHIPDDRNGIKFNKPSGEILKSDELGIASQTVHCDNSLFDAAGQFAKPNPSPRHITPAAAEAYAARYLNLFPHNSLSGLRIGIYQHSAVGRDLLVRILTGLGATTIPLGRSETFIPVDTEAIRSEDVQLAHDWAAQSHFDAIVSADGDSDRPLVSDEHGVWQRGDILGILCAKFLEADSVCTPVSCNSAVEKCGWFKEIRRTRIGSPYVIAAMMDASASGAHRVVGYEANGGFLINSDLPLAGKILRSLPTRDAVIVTLGVLLLAMARRQTISALVASLPPRYTHSDRLKNFPAEKSAALLARFNTGNPAQDRAAVENIFSPLCGSVKSFDRTDGLRITFENEDVIHLRPSGNAPEFRCYTESAATVRAHSLNKRVLEVIRSK